MHFRTDGPRPNLPPLRTGGLTTGSRIILPCYALLALSIGFCFLFQSPTRTSSAVFEVARDFLPFDAGMRGWGVIFLSLGAAKTAAWVLDSRRAYLGCLTLGVGVCTFWTVLIFIAAALHPEASYTSAIWPAFASVAHLASIASLSTDRVIR